MAFRLGQSAEADRYRPGGRNYRGPVFGQQQQSSPLQLKYSIPTGGFMGQNQIGGQSRINVYRRPEPELTPEELEEQQFKERAEQYQRDAAEFQLAQREAELEQSRRDRQIQENKDRNAARQIANRTYILDGKPVSGEEMKAASGRYFQNYTTPPEVTPEQQRANSLQQSLRQFTQNPMQFLLGGGQNVGELFNYLSRANQLFSLTGQEGSFMDSLFGQSRPIPVSSQGNRVGSSMNQATVPNKNISQYPDPPPRRAYTPGSSFASQGFTREEALASMNAR